MKKTIEKIQVQNPNWFIIGGITAVIAFIFFQPFFGIICISALMAVFFLPLYKKINKHTSAAVAANATLLASVVCVLIPLFVIITVAISQATMLATTLSHFNSRALQSTSQPIIDSINSVFAPLGVDPAVSYSTVQGFLKSTLPAVLKASAATLVNLASSVPMLMSVIIIYGYLFSSFLIHNKSIVKTLKELSPFDDTVSNLYLKRLDLIAKASLKGQFIIALIGAILSAWLLFLVGLGSYFFLFIIIFTILGMIPLGTGIIIMPIGVLAMINGQFWEGFWVLAIYLVVICNIDNFLKPRFIPKEAHLLPAMTTLSIFCGIYYFGLMGVVYGPLIAILLTTTLEIYLQPMKKGE